jgi:hypothetical protein
MFFFDQNSQLLSPTRVSGDDNEQTVSVPAGSGVCVLQGEVAGSQIGPQRPNPGAEWLGSDAATSCAVVALLASDAVAVAHFDGSGAAACVDALVAALSDARGSSKGQDDEVLSVRIVGAFAPVDSTVSGARIFFFFFFF